MPVIRTIAVFLVYSLFFNAWADHKDLVGPPKPAEKKVRAVERPECADYKDRFLNFGGLGNPGGAEEKPDGAKLPVDTKKFGHSKMGDHYSEGRRRQTPLWGGSGKVQFPTSTKNEKAQAFFEQGLGQLHGYDRDEAERSFRQALAADPDFPMAYWGLIMATGGNRAEGFLKEAKAKLPKWKKDGKVNERELAWLTTVEAKVKEEGIPVDLGQRPPSRKLYIDALKALVAKFPTDIEAKAFLGHELMGGRGIESDEMESEDPVDRLRDSKKSRAKRIAEAEKIDKIFQEVIKAEPRHPVHHYRIHLWDHLDSARALDSAKILGASAPNIGHMWHMPGHAFSDRGMYREAVANQEASARVDNKRLEDANLFPHEHGDYAHNHGWLVDNMGSIGLVHRAVEMSRKMIELPTIGDGGFGPDSEAIEKLLPILRDYEMWDEVIELANTPYLAAKTAEMEGEKQFLLGLAYAAKGKTKELNGTVKAMECLRDLFGPAAFDPGPLKEIPPMLPADEKELPKPREVPTELPKEAPKEEAKGTPAVLPALPPGVPSDLPPLGDERKSAFTRYAEHLKALAILMEGGENAKEEAMALYANRIKNTDEYVDRKMLLPDARLGARLGLFSDAKAPLEKHLREAKGLEAAPLALLTELQWQSGDKKAAKENFEKLVKLTEAAEKRDRNLAPFKRLMDIPKLAKLGTLAGDQPLWKEDADHPKLSSMGPLYWTPPPAPKLVAKDVTGKEVKLEDLKGRPVMVIFNLGTGCSHCNEQLSTLKTRLEALKKAGKDDGFDYLVVTNEDEKQFKKSVDGFSSTDGEGKKIGPPFKMVRDTNNEAFKAFHVYDDFENIPMHGIYFIDNNGKMRWREVTHLATLDWDRVIGESKRLLKFK